MEFEAGKIVKLTPEVTVTIGSLIEIENHPSGKAFDGLAVVVGAHLNAQGFAVANVVAVNDPAERKVTKILA